MVILGVDPGTLILGYSILCDDNDTVEVVTLDVLYLKNIADYNLRIRKIFDSMVAIIDQYHPDHLAIEAPFFGKNVQSMLKLGRAQGVTIAAAMSRDLSFTEYEPATIKQTIAGNGNASKEQVAAMLKAQLHFSEQPKYMDATDALAAAYCCHVMMNGPLSALHEQPKPKRQRRSKKQQWADFVMQNPERVT